jgi:hypothetical protein
MLIVKSIKQEKEGKMDKNTNRPAVLAQASETQIQELERQFAENDRQYWDELGRSYGWTPEQIEEVWNWFGQRTPRGSDQQTFGSQNTGS